MVWPKRKVVSTWKRQVFNHHSWRLCKGLGFMKSLAFGQIRHTRPLCKVLRFRVHEKCIPFMLVILDYLYFRYSNIALSNIKIKGSFLWYFGWLLEADDTNNL